jgi:hypothetical protein
MTPWGLLAEFSNADDLLAAVRALHHDGFARLEAYAPFAIEGLPEALGAARTHVPAASFIGGVIGGVGAWLMQWWSAVHAYPIDVGGRPPYSWPMFVPVSFELTILGAAIAAFGAVVFGSGLPNLWHPVFEAKDFDLAMRNRFFVCIRGDEPGFDRERLVQRLEPLRPLRWIEVPR